MDRQSKESLLQEVTIGILMSPAYSIYSDENQPVILAQEMADVQQPIIVIIGLSQPGQPATEDPSEGSAETMSEVEEVSHGQLTKD